MFFYNCWCLQQVALKGGQEEAVIEGEILEIAESPGSAGAKEIH
jgi:hypothetical protein